MEPDATIAIQLSVADLHLLLEGLDAYEYWQLGDVLPRNNGMVASPTTRSPSATGRLMTRHRRPRLRQSKASVAAERWLTA